jgi:hypothetical protein
MRISDNRYSRDRLRYDLAVRFIRHQARTHTIRTWTGLTDDRIRKLYRTYLDTPEKRTLRHRGKSPRQISFFMRSQQRKHEASVLASVLSIFGVVPTDDHNHDLERSLPCIQRGVRLCDAFEIYRALLPHSPITFEHAAFLVIALARGEEVKAGLCRDCGGLMIVDPLALRHPACGSCRTSGTL